MKRILFFAVLAAWVSCLAAQCVITVDAGRRGVAISPTQYGLFFEEINHAGEGGLYAELIRNRNFREGTDFWTAKGGATMTLNKSDVMNEAQTQCLRVRFTGTASGIVNAGYWGMAFEEGKTYRLSLWCKAVGSYTGQLKVSLLNNSGTAIGTATIEGDITDEWQRLTAEITATATASAGKFQLTGTKAGTVLLDVVSLFPPTYKGRENGCREDLAQRLADCHPAFLRFPGGCVVEGNGTIDNQQRFEWKKTIGPIEQRPGHFNNNWGYDLTDGLGFLEYLELCEDLECEPLFVCNIGLGHGYATGYGKDDLQEVIDEVLDAIEYANGDSSTKYGAMRIRDGHPAPFNLRMIEIGNENNQDENARLQSDHYYTRYRIFREAILDKYPGMYLIGNVAAWGTDTPGWWGTDVEAVDEHYYRSPDWFASKFRMYDNYQRGTHKIYVGEYAVTQDFGTTGTLKAALGEAIYMMGAERNADVVNMMSYAPIFVNENHDRPWLPDMIRFNAAKSFGTPSYHVQRMFATSTGRQNVAFTITDQGEGTAAGTVGVGTWATAARFTNPQLTTTAADGTTVSVAASFPVAANWTAGDGTWQTADAVFTQTSTTATPALLTYSLPIDARRYTFTVRATKTAGAEGFLIPVGYTDAQNFIWWNLGGWGNTASGIEQCVNGVKSLIESKPYIVETGREYTLAVEYNGNHLRLSIDGVVLHDIDLRPIYAVASINDVTGKLYVKMVNYGDTPCPLTISLSHTRATSASVEVLTSARATDENTMSQPRKVYPQSSTLDVGDGSAVAYDLPAYAVAIVTIDVTETQIQPDETRVEAARQQLQGVNVARWLHNAVTLPKDLSYGSVEWVLTETTPGYVSMNGNRISVLQREAQAVAVGTLQGRLTIDGQTCDVFPEPITVTVAPDDNAVGYLYCHMPDRVPESGGKYLVSQTITYALGTAEDKGLVFHELNHGQSIIPGIGTALPWCRDTYLCKDVDRHCYYIVTTDLYGSRDNGTSMLGNYSIGMFRSFDLIHWTYSRCDLKKYLTQNPPTDIYDNSGSRRLTASKVSRVWAPQVIMMDGTPYIYYAVGNTDNGDCDHFYISRANADFTGIESFQLLYGPNKRDNILDADIVYNHADGLYHMSYRDYEAADIRDITCRDLLNPVWSTEAVTSFTDGSGFEASSVFRRINDDVWNVGNVNYGNRRGFHFHTADGLLQNLRPAADLSGNLSPQHGSFVMVNQTEWDVLQTWSDLNGIIEKVKKEEVESEKYESLRAALAKAKTDLAEDKGEATDLAALAIMLKSDLEAIRHELSKAALQLSPADIVALADQGTPVTTIQNPSFAAGAADWTAAPAPGTANGVAEFFAADVTDYTANIFQTVTGLSEGSYLVTCQAFERNGHNDGCGWEHAAGSERINFHLFANTDTTDVCSMYAHRYSGGNSLNGYVNGMESANAMFTEAAENYLCGVVTKVGTDGKLTLGITRDCRTVHTTDWCCFDNFRVYRLADELTAVKDVPALHGHTHHDQRQIFTVGGLRTDKLNKGINIICSADGAVCKVMK